MLPNPFDDRPEQVAAKMGFAYAILALANIVAWIWAVTAFANRPALLGMAFLAYTFGLRHAFDADHIAAIDNVVRKMRQDGKSPYSAGFFFSLGHATIVVIASIIVASTATALNSRLGELHDIGGIVGTAVSAAFLLIMGTANLAILFGLWSTYSSTRRGENVVAEDVDALLAKRGFLARFLRPMFRIVTRSWHMYPIGFLFGLGFDTATEIGLLGISASEAARTLPIWTIMVFPALFTAGMAMMDTTDSALMMGVYGWAFVTPIRKLWYNITITAASVGIALFIGGAEALGLIGQKLGLESLFWRLIDRLNDNLTGFGFAVVGIFVATWVVSIAINRANGRDRIPVDRN